MKKIFSLVALTGMFMLMSFNFGAEKGNPELCDETATNFANNNPQHNWCTAYDTMYASCMQYAQ